jgi:choline dehydrogenase-like flavoprotein
MLGGTSAMNGQAFIANSKANIDAWGILDNPGWNWEELGPYYKKVYTMTLPSTEKQTELGLEYLDKQESQGFGPIMVSFPDAVDDPIAHAWVQSFRGLGYPLSRDPFSGKAVGGYTNAATIHPVSKTRSYAFNAYYEPVRERRNLTVITEALVEKVLLGPPSKHGDIRATGVQYTKGGVKYTVRTRREIVLSAGTFNTPKILELSGIGSRTLLEQLGIPVLIDNPNVGENLQDHVLAGISFEVQDFINTKDDLMRKIPDVMSAAMEAYKAHQRGPFTVGGNYSSALLPLPDLPMSGIDGISSILDHMQDLPRRSRVHPEEMVAYIRQVLHDPEYPTGGYFTYPAQSDFKGTGNGNSSKVIRTELPGNYITIATFVTTPLSRGSTHIVSRSASDPPIIDPRYLSHPLDLELLARHTQFIDTIAASQPLASILKPGGKRTPGIPDDLRTVSLEQVKDYVKVAAKSTFHPTSTCAMMPRVNGGVVDPYLRVWGVKGLRIVDASVMPIIPIANTQSSVYAVAERAADLIKDSWARG